MNIFFDTEFTGLHKNTTLISIGLIDEQGNTFYAEFIDYDRNQCDDWIKNNVISNLKFKNVEQIHTDENNVEIYGTKESIKIFLRGWLSKYDKVQLISDVCHYDMVLFIDLFGTAFDLPQNVNPACHDINQDIARYFNIEESKAFDLSREEILNNFEINIEGDKHNSLYDAKVIRAIYNEIIEHE